MNIEAERWLKQAKHDLESAEKNYGISAWDVCLILAQQAAEKALKALILQQINSLPPRSHSIGTLAGMAGLLADVSADALRLSDFYISARYPDASSVLPYESMGQSDANQGLAAAREVIALVELNLQQADDS